LKRCSLLFYESQLLGHVWPTKRTAQKSPELGNGDQDGKTGDRRDQNYAGKYGSSLDDVNRLFGQRFRFTGIADNAAYT